MHLFLKQLCSEFQVSKVSNFRTKNYGLLKVGKFRNNDNVAHAHNTPALGESLIKPKRNFSPELVSPIINCSKFHRTLGLGSSSFNDLFATNDRNYHNYYDQAPSTKLKSSFAAIMLLAFTYGLNDQLSHKDKFNENDTERNYLNDILKSLKSVFTVEAAKPFSTDDDATEKGDKGIGTGEGGSRRKQFNFIADVLEAVEDAVVCIVVKDHSTANWFGMPQNTSNGSGFIVREDGLILTNAHVVTGKQRCSITVKLKDGRCYPGYVEDVDYESDLATVRVKARSLPKLKLGCSSDTRKGEWVVAVGSPLNLSNTVTAGIVSNTRKASELGIHANDINYIQTDAAITFGNSGGPLINLDCEAIGINSMKVTSGISFAIPIDHAKIFLERAERRRATGTAHNHKRYMGLTILTLTDPIRRELESRTGINVVNQGVFVWQVVRGGPAFLSGIQPGDVIVSINGQYVTSAAQVHEIVKTDDKLVLRVQRGSNMYEFTVVPENVP